MSREAAAFAQVMMGSRRAALARPDQFPGPVEGVVVEVTTEGVRFTVADYDGGVHTFGPAPWNRAAAAPPAVGATCVAVFIGSGVDRPWVIAWSEPVGSAP